MAFHKFIRALLDGRPITIFGEGKQTRDFTFVDDIVDANLLALADGVEGVYNIGGGSRVTLIDALEALARVSGRRPLLEHDAEQAGDVHHTAADTTLARAILGYSPKVSLEEGLARQLASLEYVTRG